MAGAVVLVVDDDVGVLEMMELALRELLDVQVVVARGGSQALSQVSLLRPDLIILDMLLPELDGVAVLRALKAQPGAQAIPVIGVTGNHKAIQEALAAGCAECIPKPFRLDELAAAVERHLLRERAAS